MALQLALSDEFGNAYPSGYRRFAYLVIDARNRQIAATFDDYKDAATRADPSKRPFRSVDYRVGPAPVGAALAYDGEGTLDPAALAGMGVTVLRDDRGAVTGLAHDGVGTLDPTALGGMGVTVSAPPIPGFDAFAGDDNANPSGVGNLVYNFAKSRPENAGAIDV